MSRLVEGIKELLHKKDDDDEEETEYRYRAGHDRRRPVESTRAYGYPTNVTLEGRSGFQRPYGDGYRNGSEKEYRQGHGSSEMSPRREYGREESPREPRKGYGSSHGGSKHGGSKRDESDDEDVVVLMVPMCCDKCKEKVEEEVGEVEGVESVYCDQDRDRVVIRGSDVDADRCLVKAERAVKKKCELLSNDSDDDEVDGSNRRSGHSFGREESRLYRSNSGSRGRASLGRLPSFATGRVMAYDGVGPRGQDYAEKDYNSFGRMPSFSRHRNHEAEYITSFIERPLPPRDSRRDFATARPRDFDNVRRMPSFNRHRYHDAEYINTGDREYNPRTFYEQDAVGSTYTAAYNERPVFRSQMSFSRMPVGNPGYMKHMDY